METEGVRSRYFRFQSGNFTADTLNTRPVISYRVKVPDTDTRLDVVLAGSSFKNGRENTVVFIISGDGHKHGDIEIAEAVLFHQKTIAS